MQAPRAAPLLPVQRAHGLPPHLVRSDVLWALALAPREEPQAFQGLLNSLATFRMADVAAEVASARVGADGIVYIWVRLQFGSAPAHADASAGHTRSEFYVQVTLCPAVLHQPRQPDAWDAALRGHGGRRAVAGAAAATPAGAGGGGRHRGGVVGQP